MDKVFSMRVFKELASAYAEQPALKFTALLLRYFDVSVYGPKQGFKANQRCKTHS